MKLLLEVLVSSSKSEQQGKIEEVLCHTGIKISIACCYKYLGFFLNETEREPNTLSFDR
jgi:hypothetical protein